MSSFNQPAPLNNIRYVMRLPEEQTVRLTCEDFKLLVEDRIAQTLCGVEPQQLKQAMLHAAHGGKMVRPLVTMFSAATVGGERTGALDAASAIEMLHNGNGFT